MSPKLIDTENMVSVSGILVAAVDIRGHLGTRKSTQEELTRVEADARDEERLKVGKAEDDARRSRRSRPKLHLKVHLYDYANMLPMIFPDILWYSLSFSEDFQCQICCQLPALLLRWADDGPRRWPARWRRRCPTPAIASSAKWSRSWRTWSEGTAQASTDGTENHHILVVYIMYIW